MSEAIRVVAGADLPAVDLEAILRLRCEVFVVEQDCAYADVDGRDVEPGALHVFVVRADGSGVEGCLRVLDDGDERRIGRVVTAPDRRGAGLARGLMRRALEVSEGPWVLSAQAHLQEWYSADGFVGVGELYDEDGIPHRTMRRPSSPTVHA